MEVDRSAPLVSKRDTFIEAPPAAVWKILTDFTAWPEWNTGVKSMQMSGPLAPGTVFRWSAGGMSITSTLEVVEPETRIGWRGEALGTRAVHIFTLALEDHGTRVATEESLRGWLASTMKLFSPRFLENALDATLASIKKAAER